MTTDHQSCILLVYDIDHAENIDNYNIARSIANIYGTEIKKMYENGSFLS